MPVHDSRYIEFISNIRKARKDAGLSQDELGEILNQTQAFISKVETCERRLDVIEAVDWCNALGTELAQLLPTSATKPDKQSRQKK